jgi:hypothetical protein
LPTSGFTSVSGSGLYIVDETLKDWLETML